MSKYIDADKLIAEIERRIEETKSMKPAFDQFWAGQISAFKGAIKITESLQQEQPEVALEKGETINTEILLGENGKPYIHSFEVYDYNKNIPLFLPGTEVTLQIRKVEQNG